MQNVSCSACCIALLHSQFCWITTHSCQKLQLLVAKKNFLLWLIDRSRWQQTATFYQDYLHCTELLAGKVCFIWWQPHSACCGCHQACWPSLALLFCALFTMPIILTGELLVLLFQIFLLLLLLSLLLLPAGHPGHARGARLGGEDRTPRTSRPPSSSPLSLHPPRFGHETCCHTGWGRGPRSRVYHENQLVGRPQQHQVMSPRPLSTGGQWHEH